MESLLNYLCVYAYNDDMRSKQQLTTNGVTQMTHIQTLESKLNESGLKAKAWKEWRIYINGFGKDIKAYFQLDEPLSDEPVDLLDGVALKVFSNANQSYNWKLNRSKQVKHKIMTKLAEAGVVDQACDTWQEVIL